MIKNKKDLPIIIALFALLLAWPFIGPMLLPPPENGGSTGTGDSNDVSGKIVASGTNGPRRLVPILSPTSPPGTSLPPVTVETGVPPDEAGSPGTTERQENAEPVEETGDGEQKDDATAPGPDWRIDGGSPHDPTNTPRIFSLSNDVVVIDVSSWGGGIVKAVIKEYRATLDEDSGPVVFDFSNFPSLTYAAITNMSINNDFTITESSNGLHITHMLDDHGIMFERTMSLGNSYEVKVSDVFRVTGDEPRTLPAHGLSVGPMAKIPDQKGRWTSQPEIDAQAPGDKTRNYNKFVANSFREPDQKSGFLCYRPTPPKMLDEVEHPWTNETDWVAVKNKFFVQILSPQKDETAFAVTMHARREFSPAEIETPEDTNIWQTSASIVATWATLHFEEQEILPGEPFEREVSYYVGPKKYSELKKIGKDDVMGFGMWSVICKPLLTVLNFIYSIVHDYGVAIIILTIMVRLLFWPIMKKSTENMRKMQQIQPQLQELRDKYKDDQKKFLQKQQELFREHKVSPLGGCLPMLIQLPVFIALFRVLRSAVELRFAGFLWIKDLSQSEGLLPGLPLIGELNILPLVMAGTMIWQQRLTPSGGDAQQQKMMAVLMPVMMLVLFYSMPSALVLYWTTSQCLAIIQLVLRNRAGKSKAESDMQSG